MDKDMLNTVSNSIENDYLKMFCIDIIEDIQTSKYNIYCIKMCICTYLLINNYNYFLKKLFEGYKIQSNFLYDDLNYIYYRYLKENNLPTQEIESKLFSNSKKCIKSFQKDIDKLESVNIPRGNILQYYRKKNNYSKDLNNCSLFEGSLKIISKCIKYKLLIENLNLQNNPKIDIIMKKYIKITEKLHTVEDKSFLL